jgi:hypothetical protein
MALTLDSVGSLHEKPLLRFIIWNRKLERLVMKDQVWKTMESNIHPGLLATLSHELHLMMQNYLECIILLQRADQLPNYSIVHGLKSN